MTEVDLSHQIHSFSFGDQIPVRCYEICVGSRIVFAPKQSLSSHRLRCLRRARNTPWQAWIRTWPKRGEPSRVIEETNSDCLWTPSKISLTTCRQEHKLSKDQSGVYQYYIKVIDPQRNTSSICCWSQLARDAPIPALTQGRADRVHGLVGHQQANQPVRSDDALPHYRPPRVKQRAR